MTESAPVDLTVLDRAALAWFLLAWLGYSPLLRSLRTAGSINSRLEAMRREWMYMMLGRDSRITDASLIGHTVNSATFFASTTILALAALLGLLGNVEQTYASIGQIAFTAKTPRTVLELQLLLLVFVFAHSFLKLTWALRQLNYCVAARPGCVPDRHERDARPAALAPVRLRDGSGHPARPSRVCG